MFLKKLMCCFLQSALKVVYGVPNNRTRRALATFNVIGSPPGTAGLTGSAACSLSKLFLRVEELCLFERAEVTCDTNGAISAKEDTSFQKEISKKVGDHVQILKLGENVCSVRYCIIEKKSRLQFGWTFAGQQQF